MTDAGSLNRVRPGFKACPNCGGDGYENSPPMRKCGVCKGRGRILAQADASTTKGVDRITKSPLRGGETVRHD